MIKFFLIVFFSCCTFYSFPQIAANSIRYVDFHIHTSLKNYYRDIPAPDSINSDYFITHNNISNWSGVKHRNKFNSTTAFSPVYGNKSYPQASWEMVAKAPPSILCTTITPIEKKFVSNRRVRVSFLYPRLRFINRLAVTKLKEPRQKVIYEGSSFNELISEYKYMCLQTINPIQGQRNVRLVKDGNDLRSARQNNETALILCVEGAHALLGAGSIYKEFDTNYGITNETIKEVYKNIDSLKSLPHHVFFLTLSHLSFNGLSGQAKSLDISNMFFRKLLSKESAKSEFRVIFRKHALGIPDSLYKYEKVNPSKRPDPCNCDDPIEERFKGYGWEVVKKLLDKSNGQHRILIDMRHMDVQARQQYIDYVNSWNSNSIHSHDRIPLIISHAAVNAKSFEQAKLLGTCPYGDRYNEIRFPNEFYEERKCKYCLKLHGGEIDIKKTGWFHPFSINLYDEEIRSIYESDGILGITLEERVLGTGRPNYTNQCYKKLYNHFKNAGFSEKSFKDLKLIEPFMRNLLYILEYSGYAGKIKSWEHISIGSDFDGIIDPLDVCSKITDIPNFYTLLQTYLPTYVKYLNKEELLLDEPVSLLLNKLFYENGERFITEHFK
jgi:microsomal dipeptidase-like Zn-dependent dipeptidase